jgi:hypothetical protein
MELDGHPTQDLVDELTRRGAVAVRGDAAGPDPDAVGGAVPSVPGFWMYVSEETYDTEIDEGPPLIV